MPLLFSSDDILEKDRGLTFDDVLLVPKHCEIESRKIPELKCRVSSRFELDIPIISSNMDTVTEAKMAMAMGKLGGLGIIHRFMPLAQQIEEVRKTRKFFDENNIKLPISASIGVKDEGNERADALASEGVDILTIDIAHGDSVMMFKTLEYVKKNYPQVDLIAGNTATPDGAKGLIDHGADAIKVGIGPGSMCTTRVITGCGLPQLTAIALCVQVAKTHNIPVIADGGIKNSGDIVKALAAGADCVMLGSMLSGTLETPGEVKSGRKKYRGMASKDAQVSWRGELPKGMAAEGETTMVSCKGSVVDVIHELCGGIRSGMTYLNATDLKQINKNARFIEMNPSGLKESNPHGVN